MAVKPIQAALVVIAASCVVGGAFNAGKWSVILREELRSDDIRYTYLTCCHEIADALEDYYYLHRKLPSGYEEIHGDIVANPKTMDFLASCRVSWRITGETVPERFDGGKLAVIEIHLAGEGVDFIRKERIDLSNPDVCWVVRHDHDSFSRSERNSVCDIARAVYHLSLQTKENPPEDLVALHCENDQMSESQLRRDFRYGIDGRFIRVTSLRTHKVYSFDLAGPVEMNNRVRIPDLRAMEK